MPVDLGESCVHLLFESLEEDYQDAVLEHAADGWRLVQIFAPGTGAYGAAKYYELIFERPVGRP